MKKAKIILTTLILFGIAGGALAFKAKKFTLNRVYVSTETLFTTVLGSTYYATTTTDDPNFTFFCTAVPLFYFTTNPGQAMTVEAWKTTISPFRTVTFTAVIGTATITRIVPYCLSTTSLVITAI
jgi:hypothetical protein